MMSISDCFRMKGFINFAKTCKFIATADKVVVCF